MGWASVKNGELLDLASSQFDVFVTVDRNLSFQQNVRELRIAVVCVARTDEPPLGPAPARPRSAHSDQ
jgi:hypothetical protein